MRSVSVTGKVDDHMIAVIERFQRQTLRQDNPDGRIDPGGATLRALMPATLRAAVQSPAKLTEGELEVAAATLHCELAAVKAVAEVETKAGAFLPSGRPTILFERHYFHRLTGGVYAAKHPTISNAARSGPGQYGGREYQYQRLYEAMACDRNAALQSASWGRFQIMGANFKEAGFASVEDFVNKMWESEGQQLAAFVKFVQHSGVLLKALQNKDWATFAKHYNGPGYKRDGYDTKLKEAYDKYAAPVASRCLMRY